MFHFNKNSTSPSIKSKNAQKKFVNNFGETKLVESMLVWINFTKKSSSLFGNQVSIKRSSSYYLQWEEWFSNPAKTLATQKRHKGFGIKVESLVKIGHRLTVFSEAIPERCQNHVFLLFLRQFPFTRVLASLVYHIIIMKKYFRQRDSFFGWSAAWQSGRVGFPTTFFQCHTHNPPRKSAFIEGTPGFRLGSKSNRPSSGRFVPESTVLGVSCPGEQQNPGSSQWFIC